MPVDRVRPKCGVVVVEVLVFALISVETAGGLSVRAGRGGFCSSRRPFFVVVGLLLHVVSRLLQYVRSVQPYYILLCVCDNRL